MPNYGRAFVHPPARPSCISVNTLRRTTLRRPQRQLLRQRHLRNDVAASVFPTIAPAVTSAAHVSASKVTSALFVTAGAMVDVECIEGCAVSDGAVLRCSARDSKFSRKQGGSLYSRIARLLAHGPEEARGDDGRDRSRSDHRVFGRRFDGTSPFLCDVHVSDSFVALHGFIVLLDGCVTWRRRLDEGRRPWNGPFCAKGLRVFLLPVREGWHPQPPTYLSTAPQRERWFFASEATRCLGD